jgi:hypothetical protein
MKSETPSFILELPLKTKAFKDLNEQFKFTERGFKGARKLPASAVEMNCPFA